MKTTINLKFSILTLLIVLAAFSRLIPHMPNFSPLGAIGLFGAAYFTKKWQAFFIPIAATWLSDLFINNVVYAKYYPEFTWFYDGFYWQYAAYLLITLFGLVIFKKVTLPNTIVGALGSSLIFYLVTNFGCFPNKPTYTQDINGLINCYVAGIPFLKGTLLGDLFYCGILFGSFEFAKRKVPQLNIAI